MAVQPITEIERKFAQLSPEAQLDVLERLVRRVRISVSSGEYALEADLSAMAADPQIQREVNLQRKDGYLVAAAEQAISAADTRRALDEFP